MEKGFKILQAYKTWKKAANIWNISTFIWLEKGLIITDAHLCIYDKKIWCLKKVKLNLHF